MDATIEISSVLYETAFEKLKTGSFKEAIDCFTNFLKTKPLHALALQGRANAHLQLKNWSMAEQNYAFAKALDPSDVENWMGLATCMAMQNRIFMAIDQYEELLADRPDYVQAYFQLGLLYFKLGAVGKARSCMNAALEHQPTPSQRQVIEFTLHDQEEIEKERCSRPDFERLMNRPNDAPIFRWWRRVVQSVVGY